MSIIGPLVHRYGKLLTLSNDALKIQCRIENYDVIGQSLIDILWWQRSTMDRTRDKWMDWQTEWDG